MPTSLSTLTPKQQKYLTLLQQAESEHLSVLKIAQQNNIDPSLLYAARKTLRQKGFLPQVASGKFQSVSLANVHRDDRIELQTQLANGLPIGLSVPVSQLTATLKALSV